MRILLTFILLFSLNAFSSVESKNVNELMDKYEQVMNEKKFVLIPEVFTSKFLTDVGGVENFKSNLSQKSLQKFTFNKNSKLRKGREKNLYYLNLTPEVELILKTENGVLKIDGTISNED